MVVVILLLLVGLVGLVCGLVCGFWRGGEREGDGGGWPPKRKVGGTLVARW